MQRNRFGKALVFLVCVLAWAGCGSAEKMVKFAPVSSKPFEGFPDEPSGAIEVKSGVALVVNDEKVHPLDVLTFDPNGNASAKAVNLPEAMNDLEGITIDNRQFIYATTSHSLNKNGEDKPDRKRLARFRLAGETVEKFKFYPGLRDGLVKLSPLLESASHLNPKEGGLDIESLAWNPRDGSLLIGFRGPLQEGKAIVATLKNCDEVLDSQKQPEFSPLIALDLKGNGIRAMTYDEHLKGFLIIAGPTGVKGTFQLWLWSGNATEQPLPVEVDLSAVPQPEGITPIHLNQQRLILIVSDMVVPEQGPSQRSKYLLLRYVE